MMCLDKLLFISVGILLINVPSSSQTFDTSGERTVVEELDGNSMNSVNQDSLRMKRETNENADVDTNKEQFIREKRSDKDDSGSQPNNLSEDNMLAEINRLLLEKRDANGDVDIDDKEDLSRGKHDADDEEDDDDDEDDNDDDEEDEDDISLIKRDEDGVEEDDDDVDDGYDDDDDEDGYSRRKRYLSDDVDEPEEEYDDDVDDLSEEKRDIDDEDEDNDDEDDENEEDDYDMFDDDNDELQRRDTDVKDERYVYGFRYMLIHFYCLAVEAGFYSDVV